MKGIAAAVQNFVEKDDKDAVDTIVARQLERTMGKLNLRNIADEDDDTIDDALAGEDPYRHSYFLLFIPDFVL